MPNILEMQKKATKEGSKTGFSIASARDQSTLCQQVRRNQFKTKSKKGFPLQMFTGIYGVTIGFFLQYFIDLAGKTYSHLVNPCKHCHDQIVRALCQYVGMNLTQEVGLNSMAQMLR